MSASSVAAAMPWTEAAHVPALRDSAIERKIMKSVPAPAHILQHLAWVPWVAEAGVRFGPAMRSALPPRFGGLIALVVSQDNACRHCYGMTRAILRLGGMNERVIRQLETDLYTAPLTDQEMVALEYARRVSRAAPRVGPADLAALAAAGYSPAEVVEITYAAAVAVYCNRNSTLLAVQPEAIEGLASGPFAWITRPVVRRVMRMMKFSYPPEPVPAGTTTPVDALFAALEGMRGRDDLRRAVVDAQASPLTTLRQKALIMAVVAAGLDCHLCARGSRDVLRREGIPEAEVDGMVTHLASDRLDPFEVALMRFARETVRYRPEQIHAKCAEFFRGMESALAVEVVALCSLANLLGRLSVLLPR